MLTGYNIINLSELIDEYVEEEDRVKSILSNFSSINQDVEDFLKTKAILFSKQSLARTHLVFISYKGKPVLVGYFTLCNKFIVIKKNALSKTLRRRISKFASKNIDTDEYYVTAPLIAQLGKNYNNGYRNLITGDELLKIACDYVKKIQNNIGGKVVYLECEDIQKLREFYNRNGFVEFGNRPLEGDEIEKFEGKYLVQFLKYL